MTRRLLAVLAAVALVLLAGCTSDSGSSGSGRQSLASMRTDLQPCPKPSDTPAAGDDVPDLRLSCFSGGSLDLGKAPGVPTVVNLWASWCGPCREELPVVQQLAGAAGDKVRVLGVNSEDGLPQATSFAAEAKVTFPTAYDKSGDLAAKLGLKGLPYTLFIAADGSLAFVQRVPVHSLADFEQLVNQHLGVQL